MISRVLTVGLLAGLLAGLAVAVLQHFITTPLIVAAEVYEPSKAASGADQSAAPTQAGDHASHSHGTPEAGAVTDAGQWKPSAGLQRTAFTSLATIATAIGFAMILLAGMLATGDEINARVAFGWAAAAFVATGLAPALDLAPALPGSAAGPLIARQIWWLATAAATGVSLWLFLRGESMEAKLVAAALLAAPHLIGAPQAGGFESKAPAELAARFAAASLIVQAALWIFSGFAAGALWVRFNNRSPV